MLSCNKCMNKLTEDRGCVYCLDFKSNYLTVQDDAIALKATKVGNAGLKAVFNELGKLEKELAECESYNPVLNRELQIVVKNMTMLMEAVRKLKDGEDEEKETSLSEQTAIFTEWLAELPVMIRKDVLKRVNVNFAEAN